VSGRPVRFYFSLRSPYSWLAWHDLRHRDADVARRIDWRPFWEPDEGSRRRLAEAGATFPYTPMSREKHLYMLQDVRRLVRARGLPVGWPVDTAPRWEVPHLAYLWARHRRRGAEFIAAAYRQRWELGNDICDPRVVAGIAAELELDPVALSSAADDESLWTEATGCLLDVCRDQVFGVPYFRYGYDRYWGLDRLPAFVAAVRGTTGEPVGHELAGHEVAGHAVPRTMASAGHRDSDWGHAGGCG
jgi:2-hydroxychromene-2-carboxylate isomerase